jgi:hypothetical protein
MTAKTTNDHNLITRIFRRLPIVGYAMRCITESRHNELALLGVNALMALAVGLLVFGYPFLIATALAAAAIAALGILSATLD